MRFRRVHTSYDLLDAHVLTALLREHGIEAWLFDADFVRQNWFAAIAYGGYRIMVREQDAAAARELLQEQRSGQLALPDATDVPCPRCAHSAGIEDPQPRRNVFLAALVLGFAGNFALLFRWHPSPTGILVVCAVQMAVNITVPWLVMRYFKWRLRCSQCGYRWREPPLHHYAELRRMAENPHA